MRKFEGKKLLLLGSNVGTLDLIRYAKDNGAYTIVADNLPVERSFGKRYSDDHVMISTADIESLKKYIQDNKIDGVFAGISEFNLLKAMELCHYFGFPFYCTREQWDLIENKESFRNLCLKFDVPCPRTYFTGETVPKEILNSIQYPVIVKPVDSSASVGVSICRDYQSLCEAVPEAIKNSEKGRIIIEEFFEGEEFTAHYTIINGKILLASVDNRVSAAVHSGDVTTVPLARIYPSTFIREYIDQVNDKMIDLCFSLGMGFGVLFVQGLFNKEKNRFVIFEAGLRCAGEAPYRILEKTNGVSFMSGFVDYALLGKVDSFLCENNDPYLHGKTACVISFVSKGGCIGNIFNYDDIELKVPSIVDKECRYRVGDMTPCGDTLRQIVLRFVLVCDSEELMVCDVETINNAIQVLDEKGEDMCYQFDVTAYMNDRKKKLFLS